MKLEISTFTAEKAMKFIERDPINNFSKLLKWARLFSFDEQGKKYFNFIKKIWTNDESCAKELITKVLSSKNKQFTKKLFNNFFINSAIKQFPITTSLRKKYDCNIPWTILLDPTSACNLNCKGCWASEYDKKSSLTNEQIDSIISQGKKLGMHFFIYSGGEPLVRKYDLIELAQKHDDCFFLSFTNGTLIDKDFADEVAKTGNLTFAISVEGFEKETDFRRGKGTYKKVMNAMNLLKERGIGFGFSTCYHSKNYKIIGSDKYINHMIKKGCLFGWLFTYMPLGKNAVPELICSADQRKYMFDRLQQFRKTKPIFLMDFWNDAEYVGGCIAGGRNYLHINSEGDVEPCAFIHYSNVNIKDVTLLEALHSPLFMEYKKGQPFNNNPLQPCPLLDNPNKLKNMVIKSKAYSTQPLDKEDVNSLTDKTQEVAKKWAPVAKKIYNNMPKERRNAADQKLDTVRENYQEVI